MALAGAGGGPWPRNEPGSQDRRGVRDVHRMGHTITARTARHGRGRVPVLPPAQRLHHRRSLSRLASVLRTARTRTSCSAVSSVRRVPPALRVRPTALCPAGLDAARCAHGRRRNALPHEPAPLGPPRGARKVASARLRRRRSRRAPSRVCAVGPMVRDARSRDRRDAAVDRRLAFANRRRTRRAPPRISPRGRSGSSGSSTPCIVDALSARCARHGTAIARLRSLDTSLLPSLGVRDHDPLSNPDARVRLLLRSFPSHCLLWRVFGR